MIINQTIHYTKAAVYALVGGSTILAMVAATFVLAEPVIGHGQSDTSTFTIQQTITDESSFLVNPSPVAMVGSINGVTGGNATGTTQFVVQSNNSAGYYVEIAFFDNAGAEAMYGDDTGDEALRDYSGDVAGEPSYGYTASSAAQFAYTVTSSTTADTDQSFLNNGVACNAGGNQFPTGSYCWKAPAVAGFRIVDRDSSATNGATSTLTFDVEVPSGAVPVPQAETYTATATLSLFVK